MVRKFDRELKLEAIRMASEEVRSRALRRPPRGLIIHSDRGVSAISMGQVD